MIKKIDISDMVTGQCGSFEITARFNQQNPEVPVLDIVLISIKTNSHYRASYQWEKLNPEIKKRYENLWRFYESIYELIKNKDSNLKISENGIIKIQKVIDKKGVKFWEIKTEVKFRNQTSELSHSHSELRDEVSTLKEEIKGLKELIDKEIKAKLDENTLKIKEC